VWWIKLTHVGFRAHVKIASRIVSYRTYESRLLRWTSSSDNGTDPLDSEQYRTKFMSLCLTVCVLTRGRLRSQSRAASANPRQQSKQWVDWSWVNGSNGSVFWIGHVYRSSVSVDTLSPITHLHIHLKLVVKATFVVGDN